MQLRGHPLWWRVQNGEYPLRWSVSLTRWAVAGETGRPTGGEDCQGEAPSGNRVVACRHPGAIDQCGKLLGRSDRHDLMLRPDPDRARRATVFDVRQTNHRSPGDGSRRSVRDHRNVVAVGHDGVGLGIDDGDASSVAVEQTTESRRKQPRPYRDENLERRLG